MIKIDTFSPKIVISFIFSDIMCFDLKGHIIIYFIDGQRSVSLSFYDDRPVVLKPEEQLIKEANTASEFGQARSPGIFSKC